MLRRAQYAMRVVGKRAIFVLLLMEWSRVLYAVWECVWVVCSKKMLLRLRGKSESKSTGPRGFSKVGSRSAVRQDRCSTHCALVLRPRTNTTHSLDFILSVHCCVVSDLSADSRITITTTRQTPSLL